MKRNQEKKGFTLVELLVVIAILAILASVTVVGYLGFTETAKENKAVTEMAQVKTLVLASVAQGSWVNDAKAEVFVLDKDGKLVVVDPESRTDGTWAETDDDAAIALLTKKSELKGTFGLTANHEFTAPGYVVETITYTTDEGYIATWNIELDTISAAKVVA